MPNLTPDETEIRILLPCHRHTRAEIEDLLSCLPGEVKLILTYRNSMPDEYGTWVGQSDQIEIADLSSLDHTSYDLECPDLFVASIESLFTDPATALMWERSATSAAKHASGKLTGSLPSFHKGSAQIAKEVVKAIQRLKRLNPSFLIFGSTPHGIGPWVLLKVAQQMSIPVLVIDRTAVDGFYRILEKISDVEDEIEIGPLSAEEKAIHSERLETMVSDVQHSYKRAQPESERKRFENNRGKYINQINLWKQNWYAPARSINAIRSWSKLKSMSKRLSSFNAGRYAIFFLHYQPERTTVPDGGIFGSQLNALLLLRSALPKDIALLVKEHPSTFTFRCDSLARDPLFYDRLGSWKNVHFVDIGTDNFELIDAAVVVATITGTVGKEALIRGTPAIFFGRSFLQHSTGCYRYGKDCELARFLSGVTEGKFDRHEVASQAIEAMARQAENSLYSPGPWDDPTKLSAIKRLFLSEWFKEKF